MRFGKEWPNVRTYRAAYINSQVVGRVTCTLNQKKKSMLVVANGDGRVGKLANSYPEVSIYVQTAKNLQTLMLKRA